MKTDNPSSLWFRFLRRRDSGGNRGMAIPAPFISKFAIRYSLYRSIPSTGRFSLLSIIGTTVFIASTAQ